jgi:hypothetical protein
MMNIISKSLFSRVADALSQLRPQVNHLSDDASFDRFDPTPLDRDELTSMFSKEPSSPWSIETAMLASERLELDSMALIRGALYPAD